MRREFKLLRREAIPPNHLDDKPVDRLQTSVSPYMAGDGSAGAATAVQAFGVHVIAGDAHGRLAVFDTRSRFVVVDC